MSCTFSRSRENRAATCCRVPGEPRDLRAEALAEVVIAAVRDMLDCPSVTAVESVVRRTETVLAARGLPVPPVLRATAALIAAEISP